MAFVYQEGAPSIRGMTTGEDFSMNVTPANTTVAGATTIVTEQDAVRRYTTLSQVVPGYSISVASASDVVLTNLTPSVCSLVGSTVQRVTDGVGTIRVQNKYGARNVSLGMTAGSQIASITVDSFVAGSLAAHLTQNIATMLSGVTAGAATQHLWSSVTFGARASDMAATPNPTRLGQSLDLSFISIGRTGRTDTRFPCYLVSPRHALIANHTWNGTVGDWFKFRRPDGTITEGQVDSYSRINTTTDCCLLHFAADVSGIAPAKLLPSVWASKLPTAKRNAFTLDDSAGCNSFLPAFIVTSNTSPGLSLTQHLQVIRVDRLSADPAQSSNRAALGPETVYPAFHSSPYGGDSSSPVIFPIQQGATMTPVLVTGLHGAYTGPNFANSLPQIQAAMNTLGAGHTLQTADLSAFTDYT